ncbi:MAG: response regulator transcription factor [Actinomycetota bacterium]
MSTHAHNVLVVEDDPTVSEVVTMYLEREGFKVTSTADGLEALRMAEHQMPDLVVLDLMLPGIDGHEVFRRLRLKSEVPVVMLTAKIEEADRVRGLEVGADDYVVKPFSPRELTLRIKAILKRRAPAAERPETDTVVAGDIRADLRSREVSVNGSPVVLTALEFDLLSFLMRHPSRVFSREALLERVWGYQFGDTSTVTVHIRRLREKVESDPVVPKHLVTVWGVGYRFDL